MASNCYNLTPSDGGDIIDWTNSSGPIIKVIGYVHYPNMFYQTLNATHYQWCGPMLMIVEYLAKFTGTRIQIDPIRSLYEMAALVIDGNPLVNSHLGLLPITASFIQRAITMAPDTFETKCSLSVYLTYIYPSHVLAATVKGRQPFLDIFSWFQTDVYYALSVALLVISLIITGINRSVKSFFHYFWLYCTVILSESPKLPTKTTAERLLSGVWLISCTVLLAAVSGLMRDQLLKPPPIDWIDSWDDLFRWKHMKIHTIAGTNLDNFIYNYQDISEMAKDFQRRTKVFESTETYMSNKNTDYSRMTKEIINENIAFVWGTDKLNFIKAKLISDNLIEDFDFHVSQFGDTPQPLFLPYNKMEFRTHQANMLDTVIEIFRESGIYDELQKRARKHFNKYQDYLSPNRYTINKNIDMNLNSVFSAYMLFIIIPGSSLCLELLFKTCYEYF